MNKNDFAAMFSGITADTKQVLAVTLIDSLSESISSVNNAVQERVLSAEYDLLKMAKKNNDTASISKLTEDIKCKARLAENITTMHNIITPVPGLILNAFRLCPIEDAKVVLLGQDPYIKPGEAQGLSFSVAKGVKIPPSLKNIYSCLVYNGHIGREPNHGDLTLWAEQGVLMLNTALTTVIGKSNAHIDCWNNYTDNIIKYISDNRDRIIFILLGNHAQSKSSLINKKNHSVLEWGHPSPLNTANQTDNPKNFKYCNVFTRTNDILVSSGKKPINWNVDAAPDVVTENNSQNNTHTTQNNTQSDTQSNSCSSIQKNDNHATLTTHTIHPKICIERAALKTPHDETLYMFTDGGSCGNGSKDCKSSWACYLINSTSQISMSGMVPNTEITNEVYKSSNNRGELTAILMAFLAVQTDIDNELRLIKKNICVVTDSEYSIGCITKWYANWISDPEKHKLSEKKNIDIISKIYEIYKKISGQYTVTFKHINSHTDEPESEPEWFYWKGNDTVDNLCNVVLGRKK